MVTLEYTFAKKKIISSILKIDAMYVYILCPIKKKNEIGMLQ